MSGPQEKGPRQRGPRQKKRGQVPAVGGGSGAPSRTLILLAAGAAGIVLLAAIGGYFASAGGGGSSSANAVQLLEDNGCTVQTVKAEKSNDHSILQPTGTSNKWNTDPPTSGPHYAVPLVWGSYSDPVNMGQLVHNLEHGGIYVLYGKTVPAATVSQLQGFYDQHTAATVLAPLPRLGDKIALGVWTTPSANQPDNGTAYLAKCTTFDDASYAAFFKAYQGKGPERFPMSTLQPGS